MSYKVHSTASWPCCTAVSFSTIDLQSSNKTSQPLFWRPSSVDLFLNKQYTPPHAFADMLQHGCESLMDTIFGPYVCYIRVWDRPHWSPSAMSTVALTHCEKIRGFIAQDYERLRWNKRHRESRTKKRCLQQLWIQTPYSLEKNSKLTSRRGCLEKTLSPKRLTPIYSKISWHNTSLGFQLFGGLSRILCLFHCRTAYAENQQVRGVVLPSDRRSWSKKLGTGISAQRRVVLYKFLLQILLWID